MKTSTKTEPKTDIEVKLEAIEKMFKSFAGRMDRFQNQDKEAPPSLFGSPPQKDGCQSLPACCRD